MSFKFTAAHIAKAQGIPMAHAQAILASGAQHATLAAIHNNPKLLKVTGVTKAQNIKS